MQPGAGYIKAAVVVKHWAAYVCTVICCSACEEKPCAVFL